jgi:K+-transporting ATPase ATPase C chain
MLRPAIVLFLMLSIITGVVYPVFVLGVGKVFFAEEAQGSLISHNGTNVGSVLIGQNFTEPKYFWGRLSATANNPYNALASGGSNLGPLNPALIDTVKARAIELQHADPQQAGLIPVELVTASGSGLDPHISPAAAFYQAQRVASARGMSIEKVNELINAHTEGRQFVLFGEPRINVLQLNLALDQQP